MTKRKLWKWSLTGATYMRTGIAFATDPDKVMEMLSKEGFICEQYHCEELDQEEDLHILMECVMNSPHIC